MSRGLEPFEYELGSKLRGRRATMGKSLLDVQRELRVKASYISAIENGDTSPFPNTSFVAGYVRSYARYLGLDPENIFEQFCRETRFDSHNLVMKSNKLETTKRVITPKAVPFKTTHTWWQKERTPINAYVTYDGWFLTSALFAITATVLLLLNLPSGPVFGISRFTVSFVGGVGGFVLVQWFHPDKIFSRMVYGFFGALMGVTLFGVRINFKGENGSQFSGLDMSLGSEPNDATIWALGLLTAIAMILHYLKSRT